MTPALMAISTRQQLADLAPDTKGELIAFIRNKMAIIAGNAELIAGPAMPPIKLKAKGIARDAQRFIEEVEDLLESGRTRTSPKSTVDPFENPPLITDG